MNIQDEIDASFGTGPADSLSRLKREAERVYSTKLR